MKNILYIVLAFSFFGGCKPYESVAPLEEMRGLEYPFETKFAELPSGINLAYIDEGSGQNTIIFIHGLGSYLPAWKYNIEALRSDFRVIAVDLPGYGQSEKDSYPYSMKFFAATLVEFMDAMGISTATIAGHSMGGQIGITMSLYHPARIENLILVAPAGFETFTEGQKEWFRNVFSMRTVKLTPPETVQSNFAYNFYEFPEDAQFMIEDRLAMRFATDFDGYCYAIVESVRAMVDDPVFEFLGAITHPTLIFFGENDNLIPNKYLNPGFTSEIAKRGHEKISGSKLIMIPKCGHFAQFEKPEIINNNIKKFLEENR